MRAALGTALGTAKKRADWDRYAGLRTDIWIASYQLSLPPKCCSTYTTIQYHWFIQWFLYLLHVGMIVDSLYCNINCRIVYFSTINWVVRPGASVFRANKPWCTTSMQRELDASFPKSDTGCTESKHRNFQNTVAVRWYQVTQSAEC